MSNLERIAVQLIAGLIAIGLAGCMGYWWGWHHEKEILDAYKAKVEAAAQVQAEAVKRQEKEHAKLTEDIVDGYETQLSALNKLLAARRMHHDGPGPVPSVPQAASRVDDAARESTTDSGCADLEARAARDALKLQNLQDWLRGL